MQIIGQRNVGILTAVVLWTVLASSAAAQPVTVDGEAFELVATRIGPQLFLLVSDSRGKIYAGNNSNDVTGIPVQRFDPSASAPAFKDFGPPVGDADGMAFAAAAVLVADKDQGIMRIPVSSPGGASLFLPGVAQGPFGSPFAYRPSDGHIFAGEFPAASIRAVRFLGRPRGDASSDPTGRDDGAGPRFRADLLRALSGPRFARSTRRQEWIPTSGSRRALSTAVFSMTVLQAFCSSARPTRRTPVGLNSSTRRRIRRRYSPPASAVAPASFGSRFRGICISWMAAHTPPPAEAICIG